jgi:hypothetical protein
VFSMPALTTTKTFRGQPRRPQGGCYEAETVTGCPHNPLPKKQKLCYATRALIVPTKWQRNQTRKSFDSTP